MRSKKGIGMGRVHYFILSAIRDGTLFHVSDVPFSS